MKSRHVCAAFLLVTVMTAAAAVSSRVDAAPIAPSLSSLRDAAGTTVIHIKRKYRKHRRYRRPIVRIHPRIAPSYAAYDFPYYYARGHYPTHIPPGYIYDGYPYNYGRRPYWNTYSR